MGLRASIYRSNIGKCANGGISDKHNEVVIVNAEGPANPTKDAPAVAIARNSMGNPIIVPAAKEGTQGMAGPMMGGCFIATSDSRFREAIKRVTGQDVYGAIPFHDRFETTRQYQAESV